MNAQFRASKPKRISRDSKRGLGELERRQRRGASGAPVVEKRTERGQGALLGLVGSPASRAGTLKPRVRTITLRAQTITSGHDRSIQRVFYHKPAHVTTKNRINEPENRGTGGYTADNATG